MRLETRAHLSHHQARLVPVRWLDLHE
jgi:hypothetical protein